ncbi:MAG: MmoB/DmpM family protein [Azospirillaceae bacterium]
MTETKETVRYVGPVMRKGDIGEAVLDAIREDNADGDVQVEEHASYLRIKVRGRCLIRLETVREMAGRDVTWSEVEADMPAFEGFIRTATETMTFVSET